jgi:hypothetical protein
MCANNLEILLSIIVSAGFLGGLASHFSYLSMAEATDKSKNNVNFWASIVIGICASFTIPLFLKILSSDLMNDMKMKEYLIFTGFCVIASYYSKTYLNDLYKKVNSLQSQVSDSKKEIRSADTKADTANTKANDLSRVIETKKDEYTISMINAIRTVKSDQTNDGHINLLVNYFSAHPQDYITARDMAATIGLPEEEVLKILRGLEQDAFLESVIGNNQMQMWKLKRVPITINRAVYGSLNHFVDVTDKIRQLILANTLEVSVDPFFLATHDPDPGVVKRLQIDCTIRGVRRNIAHSDGERFLIQ